MASLPVPLNIQLPSAQWAIADPDVLGLSNAAFVTVRPDSGPYTPVITVSGGVRSISVSPEEIADESVQVLSDQAGAAEVLRRRPYGDESSPGVAQLLAASLVMDGNIFDLRQTQLIVTTPVVDDPLRQVVLLFTLTCTADQVDVAGREFQGFVDSTRPVDPSELPEGEAGQ
jgi:hypothetical protein